MDDQVQCEHEQGFGYCPPIEDWQRCLQCGIRSIDADRLSTLEAENERLQGAVRVLVDVGRRIAPEIDWENTWQSDVGKTIRAAIAAGKGDPSRSSDGEAE